MSFDLKNDEELMTLVRDHQSHQAFSELVKRHTSRFYAVAFRQCGLQDEAEDSVQDAFMKLWSNPTVWKDDSQAKFTTWFYRVVVNATIDRMRKRKNHGNDDDLVFMADDTATMADEEMVQAERESELEQAIQSLPERQKTALNLCFYEGLSNKEAADILGVSAKGVESLLMRAKTALRNVFEGSEYDQRNNDDIARNTKTGSRRRKHG